MYARLLPFLVLGVLLVPPRGAAAQQAGPSGDVHLCDDCHGSHDAAPGRSGLVRRGWSAVTPQAPGLGPASERCLQCHGTAGDRQQAELSGRYLGADARLLGGSLFDDHPLGTARPTGPGDEFIPLDGGAGSGGSWGLTGFDADASVECESCHDPHQTWAVTLQTVGQDEVCLSCHDAVLDFNSHGIASCGSCHRQHESQNREHMLREADINDLCGACHRGAPPPLYGGIEEILGSPVHAEPSDPDCKACHTIH